MDNYYSKIYQTKIPVTKNPTQPDIDFMKPPHRGKGITEEPTPLDLRCSFITPYIVVTEMQLYQDTNCYPTAYAALRSMVYWYIHLICLGQNLFLSSLNLGLILVPVLAWCKQPKQHYLLTITPTTSFWQAGQTTSPRTSDDFSKEMNKAKVRQPRVTVYWLGLQQLLLQANSPYYGSSLAKVKGYCNYKRECMSN